MDGNLLLASVLCCCSAVAVWTGGGAAKGLAPKTLVLPASPEQAQKEQNPFLSRQREAGSGCRHAPVAAPDDLQGFEPHFAAVWEKNGGPARQMRHGLDSQDYQKTVNRLMQKGFRPVEIAGYCQGDEAVFAAVWEMRQEPAWAARHDMSAAIFSQEFERLVSRGYRPIDIVGYCLGDDERYAAVWEQRQGPPGVVHHGLTPDQLRKESDRLLRQGYRITDISGYSRSGEDRYAAIFEQRTGPAWIARHGLSWLEYQQEFEALTGQGYRPVRISIWQSKGGERYAAIFEREEGPAWVARHRMPKRVFKQELERLAEEGFQLKLLSVHLGKGEEG